MTAVCRYVWPQPFDPKRPDEVDVFGCDFSRRLNTGETISAGAVSIVLRDDPLEVDIPAMLFGPASVVGNIVSQRVVGGIDATWYSLIFSAITSSGRALEAVRDFPVAMRWGETCTDA